MLSERRRAVREQYEALQQRRALQDTPTHTHTPSLPSHVFNPASSTAPLVLFCPQARPALTLDSAQKAQLQLQVQQVRRSDSSTFPLLKCERTSCLIQVGGVMANELKEPRLTSRVAHFRLCC